MGIIALIIMLSLVMIKIGRGFESFERRRKYYRRQSKAWRKSIQMEAAYVGWFVIVLLCLFTFFIAISGG